VLTFLIMRWWSSIFLNGLNYDIRYSYCAQGQEYNMKYAAFNLTFSLSKTPSLAAVMTILKQQYLWPILIAGITGCTSPQKSTPPVITPSESFANDFIRGYWADFKYNDTSLIRQLTTHQDVFSNYAKALTDATPDSARASILNTLSQVEGNHLMYYFFCGLFEQYFYNPNSPIRNEALYAPVLQHQYKSASATPAEKENAKLRLALLERNNPGTKATDFSFVDGAGQQQRLYDLDAPLLLLFFYNPECESCAETIRWLKNAESIKDKLTIAAIYPDRHTDIWQRHASEIPATWINGHDNLQTIKNERLYDLKAIPSLYLLDAEKKVILKDTDLRTLKAFLSK
jgi:hypothetical protein